MIREDQVYKIGKFTKPHGIKGEIAFLFDNDIFDRIDCPYLICNMDGILVPFFIKEYRFKGKDVALITFEDITTEEQVRRFNNLNVYFPREYFEENEDAEVTFDYFIGFSVIDKELGNIGKIIDFDDSTVNTLFLVVNEENTEIIIPASEDFFVNIDTEKKILFLDLPLGLI